METLESQYADYEKQQWIRGTMLLHNVSEEEAKDRWAEMLNKRALKLKTNRQKDK